MSEFLSLLDELKNQFLENFIAPDSLLEVRVQFNSLDEIVVDPIENPWLIPLK